MNKKALLIRSRISKKSYNEFFVNAKGIEGYIAALEGTHFERYIRSSDLKDREIKKFSFTKFVTDKIIYEKIQEIETIEDIFFISKIFEQGYFNIVDDFKKLSIKKNMSISKEYGIFYTPIKIAKEMAEHAVLGSKSKVIIDPCCGSGNLLAACMEVAKKNDIKLNKLIGVEIDEYTANICRKLLNVYKSILEIEVEIDIRCEDALNVLPRCEKYFSKRLETGTFIINPPYGKIKFDRDILQNSETKLGHNKGHIKRKIEKVKSERTKVGNITEGCLIGKGGLEWSKIFLALCSKHIIDGEKLVFIGPCGWLNSISQADIRKELIINKSIKSIHFISETNTGFETVNQPLAIVVIDRDKRRNDILFKSEYGGFDKLSYKNLENLEAYSYPIPRARLEHIELFLKMQKFKKIRDFDSIFNLRGELDQSLNKDVITQVKSSKKIIRGENIGRFSIIKDKKRQLFYVNEDKFMKQIGCKPKGKAHHNPRIVGRQCSYMGQKRRLVFSLVPAGYIVGNSCNYIELVEKNDLLVLLGLLNSALMDWYFRILNGNNHVANYEIDDFPLPILNKEYELKIRTEVKKIIESQRLSNSAFATTYSTIEAKLDALVFQAYQLNRADIKLILENHELSYQKNVIEIVNEKKIKIV